jgi:recombination protein RecA
MAAKEPIKPANTLTAFRDQMVKSYGASLTRREEQVKRLIIPTGSLTLDMATRVGGWPSGRLHELVGQEGVGKTTLSICSMREAQQLVKDRGVCYIDMEQTFEYEWAEALGLDTSPKRFFHEYADDSEHAADLLARASDSRLFSMIVLDSVGGMESRVAFEKEAGESNMGKNAQIITRMVKRMATRARMNNIAVLLINQLRANFSPVAMQDVSAGPKAMKYATTLRVDMRRGTSPLTFGSGDDKETVGQQFVAKVSRNKVAPWGRSGSFYIINQSTPTHGPIGIDRIDEAVTVGINTGVITRNSPQGSQYTLPGQTKPIIGRDKIKDFLRGNSKAYEVLREAALATVAHEVPQETEVAYDSDGAHDDD